MKQILATRALVIAGIIGLAAAGITQPASANTISVINIDNSTNPKTEGVHDGFITCGDALDLGICQGLTDVDDLFEDDVPLAGDPWSDTTADPYNFPNADPGTISSVMSDFLGEPVVATQSVFGFDTLSGCTDDTSCSFTSDALYLVWKIDGWESITRNISGAIQTYSWAGQHGLSNIYEIGVIPIPATLPLFLTGLLGFGFLARRRRQMAEA